MITIAEAQTNARPPMAPPMMEARFMGFSSFSAAVSEGTGSEDVWESSTEMSVVGLLSSFEVVGAGVGDVLDDVDSTVVLASIGSRR